MIVTALDLGKQVIWELTAAAWTARLLSMRPEWRSQRAQYRVVWNVVLRIDLTTLAMPK